MINNRVNVSISVCYNLYISTSVNVSITVYVIMDTYIRLTLNLTAQLVPNTNTDAHDKIIAQHMQIIEKLANSRKALLVKQKLLAIQHVYVVLCFRYIVRSVITQKSISFMLTDCSGNSHKICGIYVMNMVTVNLHVL